MSRIYISVEAHISVAGIISDAVKTIERATGTLETTDYTHVLDNIGIIINSFDKEWTSWGYGKPRKYISYAKRYADIRLSIPAEELLAADKNTRLLMVRDIIIASIKVIDDRLNKRQRFSFDGERLIELILEKTAGFFGDQRQV